MLRIIKTANTCNQFNESKQILHSTVTFRYTAISLIMKRFVDFLWANEVREIKQH
jgi:hypothetical protein